jgi:outer membrane protein OmpA-like peptidoglycan-associated protein
MAALSFSKQAILDENAAQSNTIATQEQHVAASGLQTKARNQKPDSTALKMATAQNPILNKVQILDNQTGKPVVYKLTVSDNNSFMKELDNQEEMKKEFETWDWKHIMVLARGYLPIGFNVEEWQKLEENELYLEPASTGASLVLKNIQFGRGTSEFADAKTLQELDRLVLFMNENEDIIIRLEGHTDNIGDPGLNKELSLSRASKIRTHLALKGIDYERIRTSGWGGTRPLADNNTEEGREMNRRVELYIER